MNVYDLPWKLPSQTLTTMYFTHVLIVRYPYFSLENDFNGC